MTKKTRRSKARRALLALSLVLVTMMVTVGGTIAWLTAQTDAVVNEFTTSDITVGIEETQATYQMVPGHTIAKDPKAWIGEGSQKGWLFVEITESANFNEYMTYEVASPWELVEGTTNVYAIKIDGVTNTAGTKYPILAGNQVTVKDTVDKADMTVAETSKPTLTFQAYACQLLKDNNTEFTAAEAWAIAKPVVTGE